MEHSPYQEENQPYRPKFPFTGKLLYKDAKLYTHPCLHNGFTISSSCNGDWKMRRIGTLMVAAMFLTSCVSAESFIDHYWGDPQAQVDCAGFLGATAQTKVDEKDYKAKTTINRAGLAYDDCVEAWEWQQAEAIATEVNACLENALILSFLLVFIPFISICFLDV